MVDVASHHAGAHAARKRNTTADRAIDVLLLFDDAHPTLTAAEVSQRLRMPRSTTYRYLESLRSSGLVEEDEARAAFRLGPRIFQLARVARRGLDLVEIALPVMRELARQTGESVLLTRRSGDQVVCVERVDSPLPARLSYERGHVLPVHAGASAKVLLAFAAPEEIDDVLSRTVLPRFTENTVTDPTALRAQLEQIRGDGYAVTAGEVDVGVRGVAAPIRNGAGRVVAGLSVAGLAFRITEAELPATIAAVQAAAGAIAERLREIEA